MSRLPKVAKVFQAVFSGMFLFWSRAGIHNVGFSTKNPQEQLQGNIYHTRMWCWKMSFSRMVLFLKGFTASMRASLGPKQDRERNSPQNCHGTKLNLWITGFMNWYPQSNQGFPPSLKKINHSYFSVAGKLVPSGSAPTKVKVLHGLSLEILASQVVALVGPSGNGKSTDAGTFYSRPVCGMVKRGKMKIMEPKRGEFWVWGWNVEDCNPLEQSIQTTKPIHVLSSEIDSHVSLGIWKKKQKTKMTFELSKSIEFIETHISFNGYFPKRYSKQKRINVTFECRWHVLHFLLVAGPQLNAVVLQGSARFAQGFDSSARQVPDFGKPGAKSCASFAQARASSCASSAFQSHHVPMRHHMSFLTLNTTLSYSFSGQLLFFLHFPQTVQPHVPPAQKCTAQATLIGLEIKEELLIILSWWDTCIRNVLNKKRAPIRKSQTIKSGKRHFGKNPYIIEIHWGHWIGQKALPCSRNLANIWRLVVVWFSSMVHSWLLLTAGSQSHGAERLISIGWSLGEAVMFQWCFSVVAPVAPKVLAVEKVVGEDVFCWCLQQVGSPCSLPK